MPLDYYQIDFNEAFLRSFAIFSNTFQWSATIQICCFKIIIEFLLAVGGESFIFEPRIIHFLKAFLKKLCSLKGFQWKYASIYN